MQYYFGNPKIEKGPELRELHAALTLRSLIEPLHNFFLRKPLGKPACCCLATMHPEFAPRGPRDASVPEKKLGFKVLVKEPNLRYHIRDL